MKKRNIKLKTVFIFLFSFVAIAATKQDIYRKIKDSQRTINNVYKYLITHYVDDIDLEKFTKMSIDNICLLYTSPSPRDRQKSRMPSSA